MSEAEESADKPHEPSQKKLDDARRKGEFPRSVDVITAAAYAGLLLAVLGFGAASVTHAATVFASLIEKSDRLAPIWFSDGGPVLGGRIMIESSTALLPLFLCPALAALAAIFSQRALVFAPEKIHAKGSRISPLSNLKNKFGASGLFEFFKSFIKLLIYSLAMGYFIYFHVDDFMALMNFGSQAVLHALAWETIEFLSIVLGIAVVLGAVDFLFQYKHHMNKNRMSRKEMTDEAKQSEGDPHMKQKRRQRAYDLATNHMLEDVPSADVVIVNPTHYAVALKWNRAPGSAPTCVAKGVDHVAMRIREIAAEHAVPVHSDPPTARAIFATIDVGEDINVDHYEAVAAAIRFAEKIRARARGAI